MGEPTPLLRLVNVTKAYAAVDGAHPVAVLNQISLELKAGQSLAVMGPSGSGKSTLLNIVGTLDRPSQGQVFLDGQDISQFDDVHLATVRNRKIGFVFQAHHLLPQCTVLENVLIPTLPIPGTTERTAAEGRAQELLKRVGLADRAGHRPGQLSGGERQRVAVVRALINQPNLLLADEPTGALDRANADALAQLLIELNREQKVALLVATHAFDLAHRLQRLLILQDGRLQPAPSGPVSL